MAGEDVSLWEGFECSDSLTQLVAVIACWQLLETVWLDY